VIELFVVLVIVGVLLYLLNTYVPMAAPIKTIINVLVILFVIIWVLSFFGLTHFDFSSHYHRFTD
jgi:hypothetical protein